MTGQQKQYRAVAAFARHGVLATLVDPAPAYDTEGTTDEAAAVSYSVRVIGPVDDARRWIAESTASTVVATFYTPGGPVKPRPQWRLVLIDGRTFTVAAVTASNYLGSDLVYRMDCGEVAA